MASASAAGKRFSEEDVLEVEERRRPGWEGEVAWCWWRA
jgi:hypothetical protein